MTASGTTTFSPNYAKLMTEAFERAGIDPKDIAGRHIRSAMFSMELMLTAWAARGVRQWKVNTQVQQLVSGISTYNLPAGTLDVQAVMFRQPNADNGMDLDIRMTRITEEEYLKIPEKELTASISSKYLIHRDRDTPTITIWQIPDSSANQLVYLQLARLNDAGEMVNTPDVPFYWFEVIASGWAARIAQKWNYDRYKDLKQEAEDSFKLAAIEDVEHVDIRLSYQCGGQG